MSNPVLVDEKVEEKDVPSERFFFYDPVFRYSLAMNVDNNGDVFVAMTACRESDIFQKRPKNEDDSRRNARVILEGRLAKAKEFSEVGVRKECRFALRFPSPYVGNFSRKDVWFPFLDSVREFVYENYGEEYEYEKEDGTEGTFFEPSKRMVIDHLWSFIEGYADITSFPIEELSEAESAKW